MRGIRTFCAALLALCVAGLAPQGVYASLVEPGRTGSLTIYSLAVEDTAEGAAPGTGEATDAQGEPLANIGYTVTRVGDESTDPETAQAVTGEDAYSKTTATDENGRAHFAELAQGVYLVQQVESAAVEERVADFLVGVPMTNPAGSSWIYDVSAYPKYRLSGPPTVDAFITAAGNKYDSSDLQGAVEWVVAAQVPGDVKDAQSYRVQSTMHAYLAYVDGSANVYAQGDGAQPVVLDGAEDYTAAEQDGVLSVALTQKGFDKLAAIQGAEPTLYVGYETTLDIPADALKSALATPIAIGAEVHYTGSLGRPTISSMTGEAPYVYTGGVNILKEAAGGGPALGGASFKVYRTIEDARAGTNAVQAPGGGGDWVETTGADGTASFAGLAYGGAGIPSGTGASEYYLVQTQAPAGYNLLRTPVNVAVDATSHLEENEVVVQGRSGFLLPATGGMGTVWFTGIGVVLMGLAVFLYWRLKRGKKRDEHSA